MAPAIKKRVIPKTALSLESDIRVMKIIVAVAPIVRMNSFVKIIKNAAGLILWGWEKSGLLISQLVDYNAFDLICFLFRQSRNSQGRYGLCTIDYFHSIEVEYF